MTKIETFEDIEGWQKARVLSRRVYETSRQQEFGKDFGLRDQIRRAAVSSMSNIAEGFERDGNKEFIQFLSTAKGSVGEVRSQLYVALDADYITGDVFQELYNLCKETSSLIGGLIKYLKSSDMKGRKFT